jgi:hypothetical protein
MCALFGYAGYAAPRGPVKTKKKQDTSSFHTYTAYTAARASVETKKKQHISSFPTYAEKGGPLDKKNIFSQKPPDFTQNRLKRSDFFFFFFFLYPRVPPSLLSRILSTYVMCPFFSYAGYAGFLHFRNSQRNLYLT